jgi:hypothetical protein
MRDEGKSVTPLKPPDLLTVRRLADGYGRRALPDPLDRELRQFAAAVQDRARFAETRTRLTPDARLAARVLAVFGERMASLAVREKDPSVLREGLTGTALAAALAEDPRELVAPMALLHRAAELIGADPDAEFAAAARRSADDAATQHLAAFTRRSAPDKSPAAMYYVEGRDANGFRFVLEDPYKAGKG